MALAPDIIQRISKEAGYNVASLEGVRKMIVDVKEHSNIVLSRNTLRRLFGLDTTPVKPRLTTLNAIAVAIGYPDWGRFKDDKPTLKEDFYPDMVLTHDMTAFEKGIFVDITWNHDRRLLLEHLGDGKYKVVSSENGKLRQDDVLSLDKLTIGLPFVARRIVRNHNPMGCYQASAGSAIHKIEIKGRR